mmetsp:Transcript_21751/g.43154  ORF Transcript_21751/g.43154 Transcript_21751/m.43154 type:complete len:630 (+) Transcript_21751:3-1892(+)
MMGIRTAVGSIEAWPCKPLKKRDFLTINRLKFPAKGSARTPAHAQRDFYFKDYAPQVFRRIRARFGIKPVDYITCVCGDFEFLEFISNSKSGEFFFFSYDRKYMIKTISHKEAVILIRMLPDYYVHLITNPDTLITRFFGLHKVRPHSSRHSKYFLVMSSVFFTDLKLHSIYDLKGSIIGRTAKKSGHDDPVWKDNDFLEHGIKLKLGKELESKFSEQIKSDTQLLQSMRIMDYSLLVGVHFCDREEEDKQERESRKQELLGSNPIIGEELGIEAIEAMLFQRTMARRSSMTLMQADPETIKKFKHSQPPVLCTHILFDNDLGKEDSDQSNEDDKCSIFETLPKEGSEQEVHQVLDSFQEAGVNATVPHTKQSTSSTAVSPIQPPTETSNTTTSPTLSQAPEQALNLDEQSSIYPSSSTTSLNSTSTTSTEFSVSPSSPSFKKLQQRKVNSHPLSFQRPNSVSSVTDSPQSGNRTQLHSGSFRSSKTVIGKKPSDLFENDEFGRNSVSFLDVDSISATRKLSHSLSSRTLHRRTRNKAQTDDTELDDGTVEEVVSCWSNHCGGLLSADKSAVYFFGIIDVLIEFGKRKRLESAWKGLRHNKDLISSVDPKRYAERFIKFMEDAASEAGN